MLLAGVKGERNEKSLCNSKLISNLFPCRFPFLPSKSLFPRLNCARNFSFFFPFNHSRRQMKMLFGRRKMAKVLQLATASCVFKDEGGKKDRQTKKDCLTFINYTQSSFASRHSKKKTFLCSLSMLLLFFFCCPSFPRSASARFSPSSSNCFAKVELHNV